MYHICDIAVHTDHQQQGLGSRLRNSVVTYLDEHAPGPAYINLLADVDGFYEVHENNVLVSKSERTRSDDDGGSSEQHRRRRGCGRRGSHARPVRICEPMTATRPTAATVATTA